MSLIQGCLSRTATTAADLQSARAEHQPADPARIDADTIRTITRADVALRNHQDGDS